RRFVRRARRRRVDYRTSTRYSWRDVRYPDTAMVSKKRVVRSPDERHTARGGAEVPGDAPTTLRRRPAEDGLLDVGNGARGRHRIHPGERVARPLRRCSSFTVGDRIGSDMTCRLAPAALAAALLAAPGSSA